MNTLCGKKTLACLCLLKFPDLPAGDKRYIMCSKQVPDEVIGKLNKAITFE